MPAPRKVKGKPTGLLGNLEVLPGAVELVSLAFSRAPQQKSDGGETQSRFGLIAERVGPLAVRIEMQNDTHLFDGGSVSVAMETVLTIAPTKEAPHFDVDAELAKIAGALGPLVIFPYIREQIADLTRRSGRDPVTLPVLNMGGAFAIEAEALRWEEPEPTKAAKKPASSARKKASATS